MWEEWKYRLCHSRASWWWWMFFLKLRFHNWHSRHMCHMGRVVSSQLVVLLAISTVAGEKTQKMKCMNPTAHKANLITEEFQVHFLIQLKCFTFCPGTSARLQMDRTFHIVFYAVWTTHFMMCFMLLGSHVSFCFFPCHYEEDWNKPLDDRTCLFPSDRFVGCISHENMAISVVWGLLIGRE